MSKKLNWRKWLDECGLAARGVLMATREKRFWWGFVPAWLIFGWLIHMLSNGIANFQLIFALPFPDGLKIIWENFLAIFGVGQIFGDWLPTFLLAVLQGLLIGLIVLMWPKKRAENENSGDLERAGIITGLIALGAGCPTCGTTLLAPLIGVAVSSWGVTISVGAVSTVITCLAVLIALLSLKRLGLENYVIIKNKEYLARKGRKGGK